VTKNSVATNGIVVVDGGPGTTGNIMPPNLVSLSDPNGVALSFNDVMIHDGAAALSPQRTRCGH